MQRLNKMLDKFQEVTEFGATPPVDFYPFLKYIPEQFLGNWRSRAHAVHAEMIKLYSDMVNRVRERRETQGSKSSMIDRVLGSQEKLELSEHQLCFLGGVAMDGGSDTTGAAILSFMKAMTCYPKVQKLAQEEIDRHVGDSRSPTWSDYQSLPYVSGVVKEAMRWRPVGGLIPPHATAEGEFRPPERYHLKQILSTADTSDLTLQTIGPTENSYLREQSSLSTIGECIKTRNITLIPTPSSPQDLPGEHS